MIQYLLAILSDGELLENMAGMGKWLEGERFSSSVSTKDIKEWVESLR